VRDIDAVLAKINSKRMQKRKNAGLRAKSATKTESEEELASSKDEEEEEIEYMKQHGDALDNAMQHIIVSFFCFLVRFCLIYLQL
jgi:hypothetical protein